MKRNQIFQLVLVLAMFTGCFGLRAQVLQLHVDSHPSPYLSDWQSRKQTAFIILTNTGTKAVSFRIGTQLYNGAGTMIAETDVPKMPIMVIEPGVPTQYFFEDIYPPAAVKYHGNYDVNSITRSGKMQDDNYRLCVQLVDPTTGAQLGTPQCQNFSIIAYQQPTLFAPRNTEAVVKDEVRRPTFRWTPCVPSYPGIVTYRLTVMEVLPGQEPGQAFRVNHPILEKDYKNTTQAIWPLDFAMPDAGQRYVWSVQALDDQDRPIGENEGRAEYFTISVVNKGQGTAQRVRLLTPKNNSDVEPPTNGKPGDHRFSWTPVQPSVAFGNVNYQLQIYEKETGGQPSSNKIYIAKRKPIFQAIYQNQSSASIPENVKLDSGKTYMWCVQLVDDNGKSIGENEGRTEYRTPSGKGIGANEGRDSDITIAGGTGHGMGDNEGRGGDITIAGGTKGMGENEGRGGVAVTKGIPDNEGRSEYFEFHVRRKPMVKVALSSPAENAAVTTDELKEPGAFKWTPVQPSGKGKVTYTLQIFEVGNGQTPTQAMRMKPMMEKPYKNKTSGSLPDDVKLDSGKNYVWRITRTCKGCSGEGSGGGVKGYTTAPKGIGANEGRDGDITVAGGTKGMGENEGRGSDITIAGGTKGMGDNEGRGGDITIAGGTKGMGDNEGRGGIAVGKGIPDNEGRSEYRTFKVVGTSGPAKLIPYVRPPNKPMLMK